MLKKTGMIAILMLLILPVGMALPRPADLPVLVFGQLIKEDGSSANGAAFLISKYNPYTQAYDLSSGGYNVGQLKDSYYFSKINLNPAEQIQLEFKLGEETAQIDHIVTANEYVTSLADMGQAMLESAEVIECPEGQHLENDVCVPDSVITGYRLELHTGWNEFMLDGVTTQSVQNFFQGADYEILWRVNPVTAQKEAYKAKLEMGEFNNIDANVYYYVFMNENAVIEVE